MFSYDTNSCHRNHDRYTLCAFHYRKDLVKAGWSVKALERMRLLATQMTVQKKAVGITPEGEVIATTLEVLKGSYTSLGC